mmetsp:Transcript_4448/g.13136  ORF Transcript_4448/g.13136 Transcript_4448/m.13136 type:complete len:257 (-) Transcript_4448:237-1007(-)
MNGQGVLPRETEPCSLGQVPLHDRASVHIPTRVAATKLHGKGRQVPELAPHDLVVVVPPSVTRNQSPPLRVGPQPLPLADLGPREATLARPVKHGRDDDALCTIQHDPRVPPPLQPVLPRKVSHLTVHPTVNPLLIRCHPVWPGLLARREPRGTQLQLFGLVPNGLLDVHPRRQVTRYRWLQHGEHITLLLPSPPLLLLWLCPPPSCLILQKACLFLSLSASRATTRQGTRPSSNDTARNLRPLDHLPNRRQKTCK